MLTAALVLDVAPPTEKLTPAVRSLIRIQFDSVPHPTAFIPFLAMLCATVLPLRTKTANDVAISPFCLLSLMYGVHQPPYLGRHHYHQQKIILSGQNGSVKVDAVRQSCLRHPGGGLLCARRLYHASHCISPSHCSFTISCQSVGLICLANTRALEDICAHTSECVHWARVCIRIAIQWVTL